jgi:uncharacterized protein (TIGR03435 family)
VERYQIAGGPVWLNTDSYDIEAKAEGEPNKEQMLTMLRALLADRFSLKVHRESKEGNVYALTVAKGGHKLKPPTGDDALISLYRYDPPTEPGVHYSLAGKRATLAMIANRLGQVLGRPVIDRTGIEGEFGFKVDYAIDDNPDSGASLPAAVQEQLGLKLEAAKGPVETLVVDHAEKPSANQLGDLQFVSMIETLSPSVSGERPHTDACRRDVQLFRRCDRAGEWRDSAHSGCGPNIFYLAGLQ